METLILNNNIENITRAAGIIRTGGLVVFPTETVYGLGADALDPSAAHKIYEAKGRPSDNPLIIHLADISDAEKYSYVCDLYYKFAEKFLPGALTVILPKRDCIPDEVTSGLNTVALRVPSHPIANALIKAAEVPIAAPSVNLSGKPSPTTVKHVIEDMNGRVNAIIDGGDSAIGLESTIIKIDGDKVTLLRPGGITYEDLISVHENIIISDAITGKFNGVPDAPGMKYRHYAPDAKVYLVDADDDSFYEYVNGQTDCGVLCYDEDITHIFNKNIISLGHRNDYNEQAHNLFKCLREFKNVEVIYARIPERDGIGLALFNRLIKAAGFEVIKL